MPNEMRDRLVELIQDALFQHAHYVGKERRRALEAETEAEHSEIYESIKTLHEYVADHLIENGVIVPPCKVGDILYNFDSLDDEYCYWEVVKISIYKDEIRFVDDSGNWYLFDDVGKTVFLTREQAEQKLKGMRGETDA